MRRICRLLPLTAVIFIALVRASGAEASVTRCTTDFTVYIDLSATVTTASDDDRPAPLYTLAETLSRLFTEDDRFAHDGDRIDIIAFGNTTAPLFSVTSLDLASREALRNSLRLFMTDEWASSDLLKHARPIDRSRTNFQELFDDLAGRVITPATGHHQVVIIASDFSDDPDDNCDEDSRTAHLNKALEFVSRPEIRNAFAPGEDHVPAAQAVLLKATATGCKGINERLANAFIDAWRPLRAHPVDHFEEKKGLQLANDLRDRIARTISVSGVVSDGSRLSFRIANDTCADVTVNEVMLSRTGSAGTSAGVTIALPQPVHIKAEQEVSDPVSIDNVQVKSWHNMQLALQPIAVGLKSAPVEYWNGDSISIDRIEPHLLPEMGREGKLMLVVDVNVSATEDQRYRFVLPELRNGPPGERNENVREVNVAASGAEPSKRSLTLLYDVSNEELARLRTRKSLSLHPEPVGDARVTSKALRADGTQPTEEPKYNTVAIWAPLFFVVVVIGGTIFNVLLRMFGRGYPFSTAFSTSVNMGSLASALVTIIAIKPLRVFEWFGGRETYSPAIALAFGTWFVTLFGFRSAILGLWDVVFRKARGAKERGLRNAFARLLFWVSPLLGLVVFWLITHFIAASAVIETGGPL